MASDDVPDFERALADLEQRVRALESGELTLDRALALYEEGVDLARVCQERLDAANQRVTRLMRGASGPEDQPLDSVPGDGPSRT
jgi:exodeoxyribonuclease VII small subunit